VPKEVLVKAPLAPAASHGGPPHARLGTLREADRTRGRRGRNL